MSKKPTPAKPKTPPRRIGNHYIRQWREHRGLSLKRTVQRMEYEPGGDPIISDMSLSRIERGTQPYSEEVLNALSHALDAEVWELLTVNPTMDGKVIDLLRFIHSLPVDQGERALTLLKTAFGK
jgi:transcriptional regulator with XRE-family HTH domain